MALLEGLDPTPGNDKFSDLYSKFDALKDALNLITNSNKLAVKEVTISNWNISTTNIKTVAHGLSLAQITKVWYVVNSDDASIRVLSGTRDSAANVCFLYGIDSANVNLFRETSDFSGANWDGTGDRGVLYIEYLK
jgi:hypothetical protein